MVKTIALAMLFLVGCQQAGPNYSVCAALTDAEIESMSEVRLRGELVNVTDFVFFVPDSSCPAQRVLMVDRTRGAVPGGKPLLAHLIERAEQSSPKSFGAVSGVFQVAFHRNFPGDVLRAEVVAVHEISDEFIERPRLERLNESTAIAE
jgi:hypothetical protein